MLLRVIPVSSNTNQEYEILRIDSLLSFIHFDGKSSFPKNFVDLISKSLVKTDIPLLDYLKLYCSRQRWKTLYKNPSRSFTLIVRLKIQSQIYEIWIFQSYTHKSTLS